MDRSDRKSFFRWLDTATDQELQQRLLVLESIFYRLRDPDVIREFNWIKRKCIEEIDARQQCEDVSGRLLEAPV